MMRWRKKEQAVLEVLMIIRGMWLTRYLQTKDLCHILGISKNTAYRIVKLDGFPKIQIGKKFYIPEDDLETYLKKHVGTKIKVDVDNR